MEPITREEQYLANIAGDDVQIPSTPLTRVEAYLARIAENGNGADLSVIAPDYTDMTFPVASGTLCTHDGKLYAANQDISTSEEWTAAHWTETDIATELADVADPEAIAEAVGDWLGDHVDPETGYVIDDSLSIADAAADAKKVGDELTDVKSALNPQFDVFNLYDKNNNVTGKYIDNNGAIQTSGTGATYAVVPVENGKTYTICRIGYQAYSSGRMLVVKSDKTTVLATVNLDTCASVDYGDYIAKKYTIANEQAAYILFNVKLGNGDSINSTIATARDINGSQDTVLTELYNCDLPTALDIDTLDGRLDELEIITAGDDRVSLLIDGENLQVRSKWDNANDIAVLCKPYGSSNGAFTFIQYASISKAASADTLASTTISYIDDDIAPVKFTNSFLGGNHGYPASYTLTTSAAHGLTTADIGKTITDASNATYVILAIPSTTTIYVCSTFTNDINAPLTIAAPTSPATINEASVAFTSSAAQQLRPAINKVSVRVLVDGERVIDLSKSGVYGGRFVDVVEQYGIVDIGEMLDYLADNIGDNDNNSYHADAIPNYCTLQNRYRFTEKGAVTLYCDILRETENTIEYIGGLQTSAMSGGYISVPKSAKDTLYNMGTTTINISSTDWKDASKPPRTFYDFTDANMSTGMAIGFHDIGSAADAVRKDTVSNAVQYFGSIHKIYPRLYQYASPAHMYLTAIGFRTPSYTSAGLPFVSWYYVDDTPFVLVNAQATYNGFIKLPDYFGGKLATVVETDGSFELQTPFVSSKGLRINVTSYGYAVIKLT